MNRIRKYFIRRKYEWHLDKWERIDKTTDHIIEHKINLIAFHQNRMKELAFTPDKPKTRGK